MCHDCYVVRDGDSVRFTRQVSVREVVSIAQSLIAERFRRDTTIISSQDTIEYFRLHLGLLEQEVFACLFLDSRHRVIDFETLFYGTIDGATVHPREVVKRALHHNAAAVILSHNHPSGIAEPSRADTSITMRLKDALALVDIRLLDHVIVAGEQSVSLAERGVL